jgi:hypothetical protein
MLVFDRQRLANSNEKANGTRMIVNGTTLKARQTVTVYSSPLEGAQRTQMEKLMELE